MTRSWPTRWRRTAGLAQAIDTATLHDVGLLPPPDDAPTWQSFGIGLMDMLALWVGGNAAAKRNKCAVKKLTAKYSLAWHWRGTVRAPS